MPEQSELHPSPAETVPIQSPEADADAIPTEVWECESNECKGWMRKNYSLETTPGCPLCDSPMKSGTRYIPQLKKVLRPRGINFARKMRH